MQNEKVIDDEELIDWGLVIRNQIKEQLLYTLLDIVSSPDITEDLRNKIVSELDDRILKINLKIRPGILHLIDQQFYNDIKKIADNIGDNELDRILSTASKEIAQLAFNNLLGSMLKQQTVNGYNGDFIGGILSNTILQYLENRITVLAEREIDPVSIIDIVNAYIEENDYSGETAGETTANQTSYNLLKEYITELVIPAIVLVQGAIITIETILNSSPRKLEQFNYLKTIPVRYEETFQDFQTIGDMIGAYQNIRIPETIRMAADSIIIGAIKGSDILYRIPDLLPFVIKGRQDARKEMGITPNRSFQYTINVKEIAAGMSQEMAEELEKDLTNKKISDVNKTQVASLLMDKIGTILARHERSYYEKKKLIFENMQSLQKDDNTGREAYYSALDQEFVAEVAVAKLLFGDGGAAGVLNDYLPQIPILEEITKLINIYNVSHQSANEPINLQFQNELPKDESKLTKRIDPEQKKEIVIFCETIIRVQIERHIESVLNTALQESGVMNSLNLTILNSLRDEMLASGNDYSNLAKSSDLLQNYNNTEEILNNIDEEDLDHAIASTIKVIAHYTVKKLLEPGTDQELDGASIGNTIIEQMNSLMNRQLVDFSKHHMNTGYIVPVGNPNIIFNNEALGKIHESIDKQYFQEFITDIKIPEVIFKENVIKAINEMVQQTPQKLENYHYNLEAHKSKIPVRYEEDFPSFEKVSDLVKAYHKVGIGKLPVKFKMGMQYLYVEAIIGSRIMKSVTDLAEIIDKGRSDTRDYGIDRPVEQQSEQKHINYSDDITDVVNMLLEELSTELLNDFQKWPDTKLSNNKIESKMIKKIPVILKKHNRVHEKRKIDLINKINSSQVTEKPGKEDLLKVLDREYLLWKGLSNFIFGDVGVSKYLKSNFGRNPKLDIIRDYVENLQKNHPIGELDRSKKRMNIERS